MKIFKTIPSMLLIALLSVGSSPAQRNAPLAQNAALRYWSAFSQVDIPVSQTSKPKNSTRSSTVQRRMTI